VRQCELLCNLPDSLNKRFIKSYIEADVDHYFYIAHSPDRSMV